MNDLLRGTRWLGALLGAALAVAGTGCSDGSGTGGRGGEDAGDTGDGGSSGGGADGGGSGGNGSGEDGGDTTGDGGGTTGDSGGTSDGTTGDSGDTTGDPCGGDCSDDIDCTVDECVDGTCVHRIDDGACEAGESCDVAGGGCTAGGACGEDSDCDFPECSQNRACDPALAACVYDALDSDGDGFAPSICGGGDCNDADPNVGPGQVEACNGEDDDCDGEADDGATCPGEGQVCVNAGTEDAECACPETATECMQPFVGAVCVDTQTDPSHCGECNNPCGSAGECTDGACSCSDPGTVCEVQLPGGGGPPQTLELCVDTDEDPLHCGGCSEPCGGSVLSPALCEGGECVECGDEGQRCCETTGFLGTGCTEWLICDGELGGADSECVPCGQEVGEPCCTAPGSGEQVCAGEWFGAQDGDPVCGDNGTCVDPT